MSDLIVVEGYARNLKVEDSKIHPLGNIESQAMGTAALGALVSSSSLMTNAPIMMMAARGVEAKTFTCEVNGYLLVGQFTTIQFKENDSLVLVISEEIQEKRHLVYAILDPKSGLLYMMYEMGRSKKNAIKAIFTLALCFFLLFCVVMIIFFTFTDTLSDLGIKVLSFKFLLYSLVFSIVSYSVFLFLFLLISYKPNTKAGKMSEKIFKILGFSNVSEQDFYNDFVIVDGVHVSVMKYRKNLKGKDPYPEDYFDKHPIDKK